jgi:hemerythrin-like domain-containing protein
VKRDPRLHGLSNDHHHALVLARTVRDLVASGRANAVAARELAATFEREIEPHFRIEEELLLPALRTVGELELVRRTEEDHAFLREVAVTARHGETDRLLRFADRLREHVRFEEAELFPCCEDKLSTPVLDAVARRSPKAR